MAVYRSTFEAAKNNPTAMDALYRYAKMGAGQLRADDWLRASGLVYKGVRIGVIAMWEDDNTSKLLAHAKVIVHGKGEFEHKELYINFPSDHFKAKVLLVTGGA